MRNNYRFNQKGVVHFIALLLISAIGILAFIFLSSTASFKDKLFSTLYPKKSSLAANIPTPTPLNHLPFYNYDNHPNFWSVGTDRWTAKEYTLAPDSTIPAPIPYTLEQVWSGPYNGDRDRYVIYQPYPNNTPGSYSEWERWYGEASTHSSVDYSFGGASEQTSKLYYRDATSCTNNQPGYDWPNLVAPNSVLQSTPVVAKSAQGVCNTGGYIAVKLTEFWDQPFSTTRNQKCDQKIPALVSPNGNAICKTAPNVGVVSQRYAIPEDNNSKRFGCEMIVYAWGYPQLADNNYQNWFRNGELRWSFYRTYEVAIVGNASSYHDPDASFWDNCVQNWTTVPNMIYTGKYKLTNTEYIDTGNSPTSTLTSSPTPRPRQDLCVSESVSGTELSAAKTVTITSTSKTPVSKFVYAFYNLDNLYSNNTPKPIQFTSGTDYKVLEALTTAATSHSITVKFTDLYKPDLNNSNKYPTRIKVNAYFIDSNGQTSLSNNDCVKSFNLVSPTTPTPVPLISNPSFESGTTGWICQGAISGNCIADTTQKYSGSYSAKVTNIGGSWGWQLAQGKISIPSGTNYCLSAYVLKTNPTDLVSIALSETAAPWRDTRQDAANVSGWQLVKKTVAKPSDWSTLIQVYLRVNSNSTAWFDNIVLTRGACQP